MAQIHLEGATPTGTPGERLLTFRVTGIDPKSEKRVDAIAAQVHAWQVAGMLVFDTETTGLDYLSDEIVGLSFCTRAQEAFYIPLNHPSQIWVTQSDNAVVVVQLPRLLGDTLVGYVNGEYQEMMLSKAKQVQARRPQAGRTVLALGAATAGVVGIAFLVSGADVFCVNRRGGDGFIQPC